MKRFILFAIITGILISPVQGSSLSETLRWGLVGAATGALLSEYSSDISTSDIPWFAGAGALTGYLLHAYRQNDAYAVPYYGYGTHPYAIYPYHTSPAYDRAWNRYRRAPVVQIAPRTAPHNTRPTAPGHSPDNRHPGVTLVPVTMITPNGYPLTITITRTGGQFVGPRGETYPRLPTPDELKKIYKP